MITLEEIKTLETVNSDDDDASSDENDKGCAGCDDLKCKECNPDPLEVGDSDLKEPDSLDLNEEESI